MMIILLSLISSLKKGVPYAARESIAARPIRFLYKELNFPSNKTPAIISFLLNEASIGLFLFSSPLINAGVSMVLELLEELNKMVFLIPGALTVSIEFTNLPATSPTFLLITLFCFDSNNGK